jgi:hypothetical protein
VYSFSTSSLNELCGVPLWYHAPTAGALVASLCKLIPHCQEASMAISAAQAKSLCTASELTLVKASSRKDIGKLSAAQLRQKIARARNLRDKWRDQAKTQRRAAQAATRSRQSSANARSGEKAELFAEVLARFEKQLAGLEAKGKGGGARPKGMSPRARSATHRATRAVMRDALKESRLEMGGRKKPAKPKVARPKAAMAVTAPLTDTEELDAEGQTAEPSRPVRKPGQGKLAAGGVGMTALESARAVQGLRVTKGKQLRAETAAKQDRLKAAGKRRIQMHASARGRRRQGKRDAR